VIPEDIRAFRWTEIVFRCPPITGRGLLGNGCLSPGVSRSGWRTYRPAPPARRIIFEGERVSLWCRERATIAAKDGQSPLDGAASRPFTYCASISEGKKNRSHGALTRNFWTHGRRRSAGRTGRRTPFLLGYGLGHGPRKWRQLIARLAGEQRSVCFWPVVGERCWKFELLHVSV
jgi:hypothetical protein